VSAAQIEFRARSGPTDQSNSPSLQRLSEEPTASKWASSLASYGEHRQLQLERTLQEMELEDRYARRSRGSEAISRLVDIVASSLLLALCAPLMLLIAALVKCSSRGPVLFVQERVGRFGQTFRMLKFRTIHTGTDLDPRTVWTLDPADPRLIRPVQWLRPLALDELPQLINVLRGDMSLVGPRPERPFFVEQFSQKLPHYPARHAVRPGITGWAQVNGLRGDTSIEKRLRFDLAYIRRRSLLLDTYILLRTPFSVSMPWRAEETRHATPAWTEPHAAKSPAPAPHAAQEARRHRPSGRAAAEGQRYFAPGLPHVAADTAAASTSAR
jgi:lipopolysaccharide/colanic/teichoic acid biosynthesis glycosyltransferase